ncbi:MAG: hypothetical protein B6D39_03235 [Anaerolineae bacterium UTCFX2]|jgi:hypothetical protein|nr:MAG: hypothetical protein B6D39_03235 [Anaerolineae bacterium UTCFX2]
MNPALPKKPIFAWAGAAAAALPLLIVFAAQGFPWLDARAPVRLIALACLFLAGVTAVHTLVFQFTLPRLQQELWTERSILLCLCACLAAGCWVAAVLPVTTPERLRRAPLEILTTAEKNPASTQNRLALSNVMQAGSLPIDFSKLKPGNLWQAAPARGFASNNQKPFSRLGLVDPAADSYTLEFASGPSAGIVELRWEGTVQRVDLYSPLPGTRTLRLQADLRGRLARALYFVSCAVLFSLALFGLTAFLISSEWSAALPNASAGGGWIAVYALPMLLVWSLILLAFWPGLMTWDSLYQWWQMSSGKINDIHPAFHTLLNGAITRIRPTPGAVAFFQIFWLSLTAGWGFFLLRKARISPWVISIVWIGFILFPLNQIFVITLWKDIPYSIVLLALILLLLQISFSGGESLRQPYVWLLLGILTALAALFRHNGAPLLILPLLLIAFYPVQAPKILLALALAVSTVALVRGPLFRLNHIDTQADDWQVGIRLMHYLTAYLDRDIPLDEESRQTVQIVWPRDTPPNYSCYLIDLTANQLSPEKISANLTALQLAFLRTLKAQPAAALDHFLCVSSLVWRITQPADGYLYSFDLKLHLGKGAYVFGQNDLVIPIRSRLPWLQDQLADFYVLAQQWYVWRPAAYLYLTLYLGVIFAARKRSWKYLLFLAPLIVHSITLLALVSSQETRFQYPVFLVVWFALGLIFIQKEKPPSLSGDVPLAGTGGAG